MDWTAGTVVAPYDHSHAENRQAATKERHHNIGSSQRHPGHVLGCRRHIRSFHQTLRMHTMPTARTLTSTAAFWLEALDAFDIRHDGPQWTTWTPSAPPTIEDHHQLTELVRDGIVIQQFLLELVTRSGHATQPHPRQAQCAPRHTASLTASTDAQTASVLLLMDPGWVQTELGGEGARLPVDDSVRGVVTTIESHMGASGLQFRDYQDHVIPW